MKLEIIINDLKLTNLVKIDKDLNDLDSACESNDSDLCDYTYNINKEEKIIV